MSGFHEDCGLAIIKIELHLSPSDPYRRGLHQCLLAEDTTSASSWEDYPLYSLTTCDRCRKEEALVIPFIISGMTRIWPILEPGSLTHNLRTLTTSDWPKDLPIFT